MKLSDYIKGLRKGKEAHRLEKESMKDPFLADALDGYRQVEGEHAHKLEQLHRQVTARTSKATHLRAVSWSIAACLVVGIGISSYFLFMKGDDRMSPLALEEKTLSPVVHSSEDQLAKSSSPSDTLHALALSAPPTASKQKISSEVLAQTRQIQSNPVAVEDRERRMDEKAQEEVFEKEAESIMVVAKAEEPAALILNQPAGTSTRMTIASEKHKVRGKVVDEQHEPVIGAIVSVKGTTIAAMTDAKGEFELETPEGPIELTTQYIGYQSVHIPADTLGNMLIAMKEDSQELNEVVVVGYGSEKKDNRISKPLIGKSKYNKYLKKNLVRPSDEACKHVKGTVTLSFYIDEEGSPEQITVVQGLCKSADQEAIRLVKEGSKWTLSNQPVILVIKF